jgi:transposase-like protein
MTLRFQGGHPVGLDWAAISTESNPEVWKSASMGQRKTRLSDDPETAGTEVGAHDRRRISPAVEAKIVRLYRDEELSAKEVSELVGIRSATVFKVLGRNGVPSRSKAEGMLLKKKRAEHTVTPADQYL